MSFSLEENEVTVFKGRGRLKVSFNTSLEDGEQSAVVTMTVQGERTMFYMTLTDDEVDYWIERLAVRRWRQGMKRQGSITEGEYVSAILADLNAIWPEATNMQRLEVSTQARNTYNRLPRLGFKIVRS